jgi:Helicase associated domain
LIKVPHLSNNVPFYCSAQTWVHTQRVQYRKLMAGPNKTVTLSEEDVSAMQSCGEEISYRLTEERRQRLESIGFIWSAREGEKGPDANRITRNSYDDQWDAMFEQLKEFKQKFGNCLVPKRYKDNPKLGTW